MKEKTLGMASIMGPEWEPAGIVSRKIAEMLDRTAPLPQPRAKSVVVSAGGPSGASPPADALDRLVQGADNRQLLGGPQAMPQLDNRDLQRGTAALGRPGGCREHQIDWQVMTRVSPNRGAYAPPKGMTASVSAPALPRDASHRFSGREPNQKSLPRRIVLGTSSSPTVQWNPGLQHAGKLGSMNGSP